MHSLNSLIPNLHSSRFDFLAMSRFETARQQITVFARGLMTAGSLHEIVTSIITSLASIANAHKRLEVLHRTASPWHRDGEGHSWIRNNEYSSALMITVDVVSTCRVATRKFINCTTVFLIKLHTSHPQLYIICCLDSSTRSVNPCSRVCQSWQ